MRQLQAVEIEPLMSLLPASKSLEVLEKVLLPDLRIEGEELNNNDQNKDQLKKLKAAVSEASCRGDIVGNFRVTMRFYRNEGPDGWGQH